MKKNIVKTLQRKSDLRIYVYNNNILKEICFNIYYRK